MPPHIKINPTSLLFWKTATNSKNDSEIWKKLYISLQSLSSQIHWYIKHFTWINFHASLFVWIFFGLRPKFRKLIWNLQKKVFISLYSLLRRIHWCITHYNLINILASLFFWRIIGFRPKIRKRIRNLKKKTFHSFVELVKTNPLMYNI